MSNEQANPLVMTLADGAATVERVGGKGASLARMAAANLPVPPGFHITTAAYRRFVADNDLQGPIMAASATANPNDGASLEEASAQIQALFAGGAIPADLDSAIRQAYVALGGDLPVAVRSSATAEDLPGLSFAGQQETYLNIHGATAVVEAVKKCWASLWTARAIAYRLRNHIDQDSVAMAVVVEELVFADVAGIMFTANPISGKRDEVVINAAWGLGEAIVGGLVTPDTVVVDKSNGTIKDQQISAKEVMTVRTSGGTQEEPVPRERRTEAVLDPYTAAELTRLALQVENLFEQPMDIEWARDADHIFVVQARPITALPAEPAAPVEWQLPNPNGTYMRASVLELLPDPLSPLFATLGLDSLSNALEAMVKNYGLEGFMTDGDALIAINGYGYYDLSYTPMQAVKAAASMPRFLPLLPSLLPSAKSRWQDERTRYLALVQHWRTADLGTMPAAHLLSGVRAISDEAAQYYLTIQSGILPAAYMTEALLSVTYNRLFKRRNDPSALTFMLGFDSAPIQAEKSLYDLAQWARTEPELVAGLTGMSSEHFAAAYHAQEADAVAADGAWPQFWRRFAAHLDRFGHAIYDLDFAKAVPADDPGPLLETLKFFMSGEAPSPYARQAAATAQREEATATLLARLDGLRLKLVRRLLAGAQGFAPLREDALADVGLGWPILRRMLREVGGRLVAADAIAGIDDVFWLTLDDLQAATAALDAGQPPITYHTAVAERRATWERQRAVKPPVALPLKSGARFLGIDFSAVMPERSDQPIGSTLHGVAGSPGRVTGAARVLRGPDEFGQMRRGDILVARITTPAWTPLFALAAGVVTDVGGPLSHSSIVAREYHIPAVLGTGVATERLRSEQRITVDGDTGTVTVSDGTEAATVEAKPAAKKRSLASAKTLVRVALGAVAIVAGVTLWRKWRRG